MPVDVTVDPAVTLAPLSLPPTANVLPFWMARSPPTVSEPDRLKDSLTVRLCATAAGTPEPERTVIVGLAPATSMRTSSLLVGRRATPLVSLLLAATSQNPFAGPTHEMVGTSPDRRTLGSSASISNLR